MAPIAHTTLNSLEGLKPGGLPTCPSRKELADFDIGRLPRPLHEKVAFHLSDCNTCCELLELDSSADAFVSLVKQAAAAADGPDATPETLPTLAGSDTGPPPDRETSAPLPGMTSAPSGSPACADAPNRFEGVPESLANHQRYRLLDQLGAGGMGVVFTAEHRLMKRRVAIKLINPYLLQHQASIERFRREVTAASQLEHSNIVRAYDSEQAGDCHFLVMEFVEGASLDRVLAARRTANERVSVGEACAWMMQTAAGLQHAHEKGMVHRDIKPHNLMLTPDGVVKILDFGIARFATQQEAGPALTAENAGMGTPDYMAPEQALDARKADIRADVYSMGCSLYHLLAGKPPFSGGTATQKMLAHLQTPAPPITALRADVPTGLASVLARMLAKDPKDRQQTPEEVRTALAPFAVSEPTGPVSTHPRASQVPTKTLPGENHPSPAPPAPAAQPAPAAPAAHRSLLRILLPILGALCVLGAIALGLIRFATPEGDFLVETSDPDFTFSVNKDRVVLNDKKAQRTYAVRVVKQAGGEYELEVTDPQHDLAFHAKTFTIKRGQTVALKTWFERKQSADTAPPVAVNKPSPMGDPGDVPPLVGQLPPFKNTIGMEFVHVPKGKFYMGGGGGHVGIKFININYEFYLGKYEVTQEEWVRVMKANPCEFSRTGKERLQVVEVPDKDLLRYPVESVSWNDCQVFVKRLNELEKPNGWTYRLPYEAEWEYACRGGPSDNKANFGFDYYLDRPTNSLPRNRANFEAHDGQPLQIGKVGMFPPNRLGLHDMHGNVLELCQDTEHVGDDLALRVHRGGCFVNDAKGLRAGLRHICLRHQKGNDMGLRLARVPVGK